MRAEAPARFIEIQYFRQWWLISAMLLPAALFGYGIVQQIFLGKPFGDHPLPDVGLLLAFLAFLVFFMWFFLALRLETEVSADGLYYKFRGIHFKRQILRWDEIEVAESVLYKPILEYGGWGIRYGFHGKAYSVSGNKGVQVKTRSGVKILIGTQQPDELMQTLRLYFPVSR